MNGNGGPPPERVTGGGGGEQKAAGDGWQYVGVGCLTTVVGLAGGGMIAVLIAKLVGAVTKCAADVETGAPCNWFTYAVRGALLGAVVVPILSIWFLKRSRKRARNSERG